MVSDIEELDIASIVHPQYTQYFEDWRRWRLTYEGGRSFVSAYLKKFSSREDDSDFRERQDITACPRFAGAAIDEIKNSIFQRMVDITRLEGTTSYQEAIKGGAYGVDLLGSSMTSFIGRKVLPELLTMKKVGIYVDMPIINQAETLIESKTKHPYLYLYSAEDIRNWKMDDDANPNIFQSLLLREYQYVNHPEFDLPIGTAEIYKHFYIDINPLTLERQVVVEIYTSEDLENPQTTIVLDIPRIPFVVLELSHSLMADIADYQISLLNLGSSDISYSLKANYPFYTEQFDPRAESKYLKDEANNEIDLGPTKGRRYPTTATKSPEFIHPSPEPLLASMKKQEQLKEEIRLLLNLAISNLTSNSAASKSMDERSLESGLSYIGLELEWGETQIGQIWSMYESSQMFPEIKYPSSYSLRSDKDRQSDADGLSKQLNTVQSKTYKKEISKQISSILLRSKVSEETLNIIDEEIDTQEVLAPHDIINEDVEKGLLSIETASKAKGYPSGEVDKAKQEHSDRLARIAIAQTEGAAAARGIKDQGTGTGKAEKTISREVDQDGNPTDKTRGQGK